MGANFWVIAVCKGNAIVRAFLIANSELLLFISGKNRNFALNMRKLILLAEDGERKLINDIAAQLGCADILSQYEVLVTGVGAINIIRALHNVPADTEVLNIGYAGSANFDLGTLVSVTEARLNHPNVSYPEPVLPIRVLPCAASLTQAVCYTNTDFVLQSDYRDCVFDMELAYICSLGFTCISAIKVVSDNLSLHTYHTVANGVE